MWKSRRGDQQQSEQSQGQKKVEELDFVLCHGFRPWVKLGVGIASGWSPTVHLILSSKAYNTYNRFGNTVIFPFKDHPLLQYSLQPKCALDHTRTENLRMAD